jgi:hypothetical protein
MSNKKEDIIYILNEFLREAEADRGLNLKKKFIYQAIEEINKLRNELDCLKQVENKA